MSDKAGSFIISLDFELMWGVRDIVTKDTYGQHILGVHTAIPKILACFTKYNVKATFAAVGFLFFKDKQEILDNLPEQKPQYEDENLSPYKYLIDEVGNNYEEDKYHFGLPLINAIKQTQGMEIGTHTFSHYYCLEAGQTAEDFKHDLRAAIKIAAIRDIKIESIIFPRNQVSEDCLEVCKEAGIISYRNNENSWIYKGRNFQSESLLRRSVRLMDAYLNISGHHCYSDEYMTRSTLFNIPSSRFLRPYSVKLRWFETLRLNRIKNSMTFAARHKLTFHLWWHPHNFGINQDQNLLFLEKILKHYNYLHAKYGFTSHNMSSLSKRLREKYAK